MGLFFTDEEIAIMEGRVDLYGKSRDVTVRMELPNEARKGEYGVFSERTYEELDEADKWIVGHPVRVSEDFFGIVSERIGQRDFGIHEFWAFDKGEMVGILVMRESLTDAQRVYGGHVRIVVRGDLRDLGYGTEIMRMAYRAAHKVVKDGNELVMTVDAKNKVALDIVKRVTYDEVRLLHPGKRGMPKSIYRFLQVFRSQGAVGEK